jgi:hypothetical protein
MTANMPLTDAIVEAALACYAERISSDGLHDEIMVGVSRTSQVRRPLLTRLDWLAWPAPSTRLAWVLLLLAGLLAAMVGGLLVAGSRPPQDLAVVVPPAVVTPVGQVFECPPGSTPDEPGPVDEARPPQDSNAAVAFDRRAGRLVAFTSAGNAPETWTFDVCTNTWLEMHPNRQPPGSESAQLGYDVDSEITILASNRSVWAYDLRADTWTEKRAAPTVNAVSLAYDPVSGLVVVADYSDLKLMWNYDVETDTWTPIDQANEGPDSVVIAYDASVDRLVAYGDGAGGSPPYETWLFDIRTGAWSRSAAERPAVVAWLTAPRVAYDEAAGKTVVLLRHPLTAYDASADRWEVLAEAEATWPYPGRMVYDPVNRRLVGLGQTLGTPDIDIPPGGVEALDLVKGERRVLLEPVATSLGPVPDESIHTTARASLGARE